MEMWRWETSGAAAVARQHPAPHSLDRVKEAAWMLSEIGSGAQRP